MKAIEHHFRAVLRVLLNNVIRFLSIIELAITILIKVIENSISVGVCVTIRRATIPRKSVRKSFLLLLSVIHPFLVLLLKTSINLLIF